MGIIAKIKSWLSFQGAVASHSGGDAIVSDAPIDRAEQDLLTRTSMAKRIAQILAASGKADGRVFAIRGAWGFGKSSLKNLVIEVLGGQYPDVPVLDFNPWQWGDNDAIARALFQQMAGKLGGSHAPAAAERAARLREYGGLITGGSASLDKFGHNTAGITTLLTLAAAGAATLGLTIPGITASAVSIAIIVLAAAALLAGRLLNWFGRDRSADSLDTVRGDLQRRLAALLHPLVVFVDDIDRLEPEQIRLVIRQIKANASLPNINFVLLFQPSIVEKALAPISDGDGRDYLEKIVQANFDLPPVTGDRLLRIFLVQLSAMIDPLASADNGFQQTRWGNVLRGGIEPIIRNLRDSRRLLSSIAIHVEMHKGAHAFEVNIIDFVALEALRVFEPDFHRALAARKDLLTQASRFSGDQRQDRDKAAMQALLAMVAESRRAACERLLKELFPPIEWAFGGSHYGTDWQESWRGEKRVCSARNFDRYFELQLSDDVLSESDFALFLRSAIDAHALHDIVRRLEKDGLLPGLARRMEQSVKTIPLENVALILALMFENGEKLGSESEDLFNEPFVACWRGAYWYLARLGDSATRRTVFESALGEDTPLGAAAFVLSLQQKALEDPDPRSPPIFARDDLEALTALWVRRIEARAADTVTFLDTPNLVSRLYRWKQFGGDAGPRAWAVACASEPDHIVPLLRQFVNRGLSQSINDLVATVTESFRVEHFRDFLPLDVVRASLARIDRSALGPEDGKLVALFERQSEAWDTGDVDPDPDAPAET